MCWWLIFAWYDTEVLNLTGFWHSTGSLPEPGKARGPAWPPCGAEVVVPLALRVIKWQLT